MATTEDKQFTSLGVEPPDVSGAMLHALKRQTRNLAVMLAMSTLVSIVALAVAVAALAAPDKTGGANAPEGSLAIKNTPQTKSTYLFAGAGDWSAKPPLPEARSDFPAVAYGDSHVIIPGGYDSAGTVLDSVLMYDAMLEKYNTTLPKMPRPRFRHGTAVVDDTLFVLGGFDSPSDDAEPLACVDALDLTTLAWTPCVSQLNVPRGDVCAAATVDGTIVVAGGYGAAYKTLKSTETLSPGSTTWAMRADMPAPRGDTACAALGNAFYLVGGYYDPSATWAPKSFHKTTFRFDAARNSWSTLAATTHASGDKAVVALPANDARPMGRLLAIGGETHARGEVTQVPIHAVEEYLPEVDTWVARAPIPTARFRFGAAVTGTTADGGAGEAVHAFGGHVVCSTGWFGDWGDPDCTNRALLSHEATYAVAHPVAFLEA